MILVDANVLLYAYHPRAEQHDRARKWIETAFSGAAPVALSWPAILAFLRISTNPRAFEQPLTISEAAAIVADWLALPSLVILEPGERYREVLARLLTEGQVTGPLVSDAAVAALALEHGAALCTSDRDFRRFQRLRIIDPLVA